VPRRFLDISVPLQTGIASDPARVRVENQVHERTPYGGGGRRGIFSPERVWIEAADGSVVQNRERPRAAFAGHVRSTPWDQLHRLKSAHGSMWLGTSSPLSHGDRDGAYGEISIRRLRSIGIRDRRTSPRSPWQNGYAERLIGSIRRECLDHVIVFSERHLRHLLLCYVKYYNGGRTHLSLEKDAPVSRAVELAGHILCRPILGGLHHQYVL
jgi:transposase InsO family protein